MLTNLAKMTVRLSFDDNDSRPPREESCEVKEEEEYNIMFALVGINQEEVEPSKGIEDSFSSPEAALRSCQKSNLFIRSTYKMIYICS